MSGYVRGLSGGQDTPGTNWDGVARRMGLDRSFRRATVRASRRLAPPVAAPRWSVVDTRVRQMRPNVRGC